jgi:hypothetical protein
VLAPRTAIILTVLITLGHTTEQDVALNFVTIKDESLHENV